MHAGRRLWRTGSGDLVEDGHPEAVHLAYGEGDEIADGERVRSAGAKVTAKPEGKVTPKRAPAASKKDD